MENNYLNFNEYKRNFYDKFGNCINNYWIEKYYKNSNNEWILEETYTTNVGAYYVVNDKIYLECNNSLIPLNMDFNSKDCYACYKIKGEDTTEYINIISNEYLCKNEYLNLRLHKQNYSDGTSFYSLEDNRGEFRVNYGDKDLKQLILVLQSKIKINKEYIEILPTVKEEIKQTEKLIKDIKKFIK